MWNTTGERCPLPYSPLVNRRRSADNYHAGLLHSGKLSQPSGPLYRIEHSNDGLITFLGGLPIVNTEGVLIGAIGVSDSTVEHDHFVAQAGVAEIGLADLPVHPWRT